MAYFPDLSICTYFGEHLAPHLRAIGWIDFNHTYSKGKLSDKKIYDRLVKLRYEGIDYHDRMGFHKCEFCQFEWGIRNLLIPGGGFLYVCPEMITHYINVHWYLPPDEFCDAILECPDMHTVEYKKLFLNNGGLEFISEKNRKIILQSPEMLFSEDIEEWW